MHDRGGAFDGLPVYAPKDQQDILIGMTITQSRSETEKQLNEAKLLDRPSGIDTMDQSLTPPEVAKLLRVSPETVLGWIRSGELRAFNVASRSSMRPSYRVDPDALEQFKKLRQVISPPPSSRKRRNSKNAQSRRY